MHKAPPMSITPPVPIAGDAKDGFNSESPKPSKIGHQVTMEIEVFDSWISWIIYIYSKLSFLKGLSFS